MDANTALAVDGFGGGNYAPTAPIIIGGSGLVRSFKSATWDDFAADPSGVRAKVRRKSLAMPFTQSNMTTVYPDGYQIASGAGGSFSIFLDDMLTDGATLTAVTLAFKIVGGHVGLPAVMPAISISRTDPMGGTAIVTLKAVDTGANVYISAAGTVGAYEAAAALQTFAYVPDQHALLDCTRYSYKLTYTDESGVNALVGNRAVGCSLTVNMSDCRPA